MSYQVSYHGWEHLVNCYMEHLWCNLCDQMNLPLYLNPDVHELLRKQIHPYAVTLFKSALLKAFSYRAASFVVGHVFSGPMSMMIPWLHFRGKDHLYFKSWAPSSVVGAVGVCVGLAFMSLLERWLACKRSRLEVRWRRRYLILHIDCVCFKYTFSKRRRLS